MGLLNYTSEQTPVEQPSTDQCLDLDHSPDFKKEYRQLIKQWHRNKRDRFSKPKGKINCKIPCVKINFKHGLSVEGLLDTGASLNFMSLELFTKLQKIKCIRHTNHWTGKIFAANNAEMNAEM